MTLVLLVLVSFAIVAIVVRIWIAPAYIMRQNAEEVALLAECGREMEPEPTHLWRATFIIIAVVFSAFMAVASIGFMVREGTLIPTTWAELFSYSYLLAVTGIGGFIYCVRMGRRIKFQVRAIRPLIDQ